ncbi:MAG: SAM-dependent chlorinase/fluorinase [Gemmatimonadetes bacterium]|nr:SAM-dependent chlorinase/fluorinase [Gemmatimonadota bacterium]MBI3566665.1 SAM-dependent chlorinase/fluorinase [Gemmatimonadota bacterium]
MAAPTITLLTDFGTADGYVAELKGVLVSLAPEARLVDATHEIPPQDVESARLTLARYWRRFPAGTVHLAVVDPGVGSARAALAVESDGRFLVGPDNGLLSPALLIPGVRVVQLPMPSSASRTFHGRDVFAPAAAALATGSSLAELGSPFDGPVVRRTAPVRQRPDGSAEGEVLAVDRFGNAITNLIARSGTYEVGGRYVRLVRAYADATDGEPVALAGSSGLVEIAVRDGNAAARLALTRGMPVVHHPA